MSLKNDFIIVLASNVETPGVQNTPANFATQLGRTINLSGVSDSWEVGLVETSFVNSVKTIDKEGFSIEKSEDQVFVLLEPPWDMSQLLNVPSLPETSATPIKLDIPDVKRISEGDTIRVIRPKGIRVPMIKILPEFNVVVVPNKIVTPHYKLIYNPKACRYTLYKNKKYKEIQMGESLALLLGFHADIPHNEPHSIDRFEHYCKYVESRNDLNATLVTSADVWEAPHVPVLIPNILNPKVEDFIKAHGKKDHHIIALDSTKFIRFYSNFDLRYKIIGNDPVIETFNIPSGHYDTAEDLLDAINKLQFSQKFGITLSYDKAQNRFSWNFPTNIKEGNYLYLHHLSGLERILGGSGELKISSSISFEHAPDLRRGISNLFIYCDICAATYVGDQLVPLLRTVSYNSKGFGDVITITYDRPLYVPINRRSFDKIEIMITDNQGRMVPFDEGTTLVTLQFRQCQRL